MDRNKIDSEIKALQSGFAGNDAIYMGKRNGIEVGYLAAVKKYEELQTKYDNILAAESGHESKTENVWQSGYASGHEAATEKYTALQAKCERYEQALKEIKQLEHNADETMAALVMVSDIVSEALAGDGENKEPEKEIEYMPVHPEDARKPNCPKQFPMHLLNEAKAQSNHSQSLKRLKERGGLSVAEILAIVGNKPWNYYGCLKWEDKLKMLNELLNQKEDGQ
jgi:hypothetical protein